MSNRQYTTQFLIGAKLLGTFGASINQANARMRSLERTAQTVADRIKHIWSTVVVSLAGFAIGNLFRKAFEGAFEAAADAQQRALSLTNEFYLHMRKEGFAAAEQQTKWLIEINQKLAQTGVLGRGVFDAMADGLSKLGLAPKEIAAMEPVLAGLLVRAKGIRATAADADELANNVLRAAKGGRMLGLITSLKLPIGPSERERLKAYKDDWRGAVQYFMFLASKYKDFNVAMRNTPLGQIQRMRNSFNALARDIGETMLPAQADMAAAWEKALPEIKPAIVGIMSELAMIMSKVAMETGDFADRMAQTDAQDAANQIKQRLNEIWDILGFTPAEGSFGALLAGGFVAEAKIINFLLDEQIKKFKTMKTTLELVGNWMHEAFVSPLDAAVHRLQDLISLMSGGFFKASKGTQDIMNPPKTTAGPPKPVMPTAPGVAPPPDWIAKNPALLKAWIQGARPSTAMTPDVRRNVEAAARAADRRAVATPFKEPPPAGKAVLPLAGLTSRVPISPAMPSIRIYGQAGAGAPTALPPGATMSYGGGALPAVTPPTLPTLPPTLPSAPVTPHLPPATPTAPLPVVATQPVPVVAAAPFPVIITGMKFSGATGATRAGLPTTGTVPLPAAAPIPSTTATLAAGAGLAAGASPFVGGGGTFGGHGAGSSWADGGGGAAGEAAQAAAAPIVGALVDVRKRYAEELKDPETMRLLMASAQAEVGYKNAARLQAYIESVMNRAAATGKSLSAILRDPKYYPAATKNQLGATFSAAQAARYAPAIQAALAGSNISNFATGNESAGVHSGGANVAFASGGERFVHENWTVGWVRRMREQAAAQGGAQVAQNQPPPMLAPPQMQHGGIVNKPTVAMLAEKGPEVVLPTATPSPLPSPPSGTSGMSRIMSAMSPFLPYAQQAMHGRFYAPSWMMGGAKAQWMQASLGARQPSSDEPSPFAFGEGLRMPAGLGAMAAIGKLVGKAAGNEYNMTHAPVIHIHGNADEKAMKDMKIHLEDAHQKFIKDFKDAQRHERRLSYESGYSG